MQNVHVPDTSALTSRAVRVPAVLLAAALFLSSCSGSGDGSGSDADASTSPSPSATNSDGVELTGQGTRLDYGESATVSHKAAGESAILELTVKSAKQGSVKDLSGFALDNSYKKKGSYYYVDVSIANEGTTIVGGYPVPLWGISGEDTLLQPVTFTTKFAPCPTKDLPKKFKPKDKLKTCLVFLSPNHGSLKGVSYRPSDSFVPIEWHGKVDTGKSKKDKNKSKNKNKNNKQGKQKKGQS